VFAYAAISRRIARNLGLAEAETATAVGIILQTNRVASLLPGILGSASLIGWNVLSWQVATALKSTHSDVLAYLNVRGWVGFLVGLALTWGVGFVLAAVVGTWSSQRLLTRAISKLARTSGGRLCYCEQCLYPMSHAEPGKVTRCPECGAEFLMPEAEPDSAG
jgi:hypothetical protein